MTERAPEETAPRPRGAGRRRLRWIVVLAAAAASVWLGRAFLATGRPIPVQAVRAGRGVVEDAVTNSQAGTVKSRHTARVGAERAGRVASIPRREGSEVKRGDVLLTLDDSTERTRLTAAERDRDALAAAVEGARSAERLARSDFDRTAQLHGTGLVSAETMDAARSRLEGAEADRKSAEAKLAAAESAVALARDDLAHMRVVAPFDGVVSARLTEVGESVVPGQAVLELIDPDHLYVTAPIDELDIGRIREGLPARVTLDPYPGVTWPGTVRRVSPVVNDVLAQNRTLDVEVDLTPAPGRPRPKPGTSADVEIILAERAGVLRVPTFSLIEGKRVLVIERGRAVSRDVETGIRNWDWCEVTKGLEEGDVVVTSLDRTGVAAGARVVARPPVDSVSGTRATGSP
ncbi:MAG TPA: efflux RND transporter periplasmic adaptor subunit [Candidatus Eisenbacteria bacterium]